MTVSVGVGRHHGVDRAAMKRRVGEQIAATYRCLQPARRRPGGLRRSGDDVAGNSGTGFRPVARADLRILIGSVLPHLQAGFGGGYKLIFPGTSHRSTLGALHRQGLDRGRRRRTLLGGDAASNPMRQAIHRGRADGSVRASRSAT